MAGHRMSYFVFLFLLTSFGHIFGVKCLEDDQNQIVILRNCCTSSTLNSTEYEDCDKYFNVSWSKLQLFRVPKGSQSYLVSVSKTNSTESESLGHQLNCDNPHYFVIPKIIASDAQIIQKKGFFTFFSSDGHFQYDKHVYAPREFCVERITSKDIRVLACPQQNCLNINNTQPQTCLVRCCNYGEVWDVSDTTFRCKDSGKHKWQPKIYSHISSDELLSDKNEQPNKQTIISFHPREWSRGLNCTFQSSHPKLRENEKVGHIRFKTLQDGKVAMKTRSREWVILNVDEYCIDGFQIGEGNYTGNIEDSILFECKNYETQEQVEGKTRQRRYSLGFGVILIISMFFLLMTAIVYILLWSKHNIHGWTVFCYILALLSTYFMLGISHFSSSMLERSSNDDDTLGVGTLCGIIGILCHFTFLSVFSWSTVLNFDIWCTFRSLKPASRNQARKGLKKFLAYSVFACSIPISIVSVGIALDIKHRDDPSSDAITPKYGKIVCYVDPRYARFIFCVIPIAILLGINVLLFCNTSVAVYKLKKSTQFATSSSTRQESGNQTFKLLLKLLLVNGIIWIVEIFSWYFQSDYEEMGLFSFILDLVNVMQGVAIFFLFVFKDDILGALKYKYPCMEGAVNLAFKLKQSINSNPPSHTRQTIVATRTTGSGSAELYHTNVNNNLPLANL